MDFIVKEKLRALASKFESIPPDRKVILEKISGYTNEMKATDEVVNLLYVCTHNSRRSQFGQVAAALAANYYGIDNVHSFSGGTEVTAMNVNALNALKQFGCKAVSDEGLSNPVYQLSFGSAQEIACFSKLYHDASIPKQHIIAIMTCSDAEQHCPIIPAAKYRIGTPYNDPKQADASGQEAQVYAERFAQILTETLYVFSLLKKTKPTKRTLSLKQQFIKHKKPIVITTSIIVLQLLFGFDAKFCIINIVWLCV